jgi:drug/metabolite transporter (DMT)-like permease
MSRRGWWLFAAMSVIWGLPYLLIRVAVRQLDPGVLVCARTLPAALVLSPLVAARRQFDHVRRHLGWIATFGVIEFGIPWYLMSSAEKRLTSSLTSLIVCAVPLVSVGFSRLRRDHEPVGSRRLVGLLLGALGVALLVGLSLNGGSAGPIVMMLVVAVGYAIGPMILSTRLTHVPGVAVVAGATGVVALAWLPWSLAHLPHHLHAETIASVAVLSLVCTVGAFVIFFELIKEAGPSRSVVVTYLNTALAVVLGVVFLREPLTASIALGFPLVIVGSVLATSSRRGSVAVPLD